MQLKQEVDSSRLSIRQQCKGCVHLDRLPLSGGKTCSEAGILPSGNVCSVNFYQPDWVKLTARSRKLLAAMKEFAEGASATEIQLVSYAVRNFDLPRRVGLQTGQSVYFSIGADYLQNYFRGYVVSVSHDTEHVYVLSELTKGTEDSMLMLMRSSVLTWDAFRAKRKTLVKEGRIEEPRHKGKPTLFDELVMPKKEHLAYRETLARKAVDYVPPSMDTVPQAWLDKRSLQNFRADAIPVVKANVKKQRAAEAKKGMGVKRNASGAYVIDRHAK